MKTFLMASKRNCTLMSLHVAQLLLYFFASNLLISSLLFLIGGKITLLLLFLSTVSAIVLLIVFYHGKRNAMLIVEILAAIALFAVAIQFSEMIIDGSYDGNSYHKVAVGLLKNGWNPLAELPSDFVRTNALNIKTTKDIVWVEGYGKAAWIFGASIYSLTGNIECGKAYTLLSMFCAFSLTYYYLRVLEKNRFFCIVFSLAAAMNPIAVAQIDSFYVDGFLHEMLYILVFSLYINLQEKSKISPAVSASLIACSMIVCANIKFTGLLYGGIYCIAYFLFYCFRAWKKARQEWMKKCVVKGTRFALLAVVCLAWAGAPTYITNLIRHRTLTYPLTGSNPIDIMAANSAFATVNHFKNWFISLFSKMGSYFASSNAGTPPQLKIPFTVDFEAELKYLQTPDTRLSGFGLFFSGLFLILGGVLIAKLIKMKKEENFWLCLMNTAVNLLLCFAISESWWARYSPYQYFIVLTGLYILLDTVQNCEKKKKVFFRTAAGFVSILFIINNALFLKEMDVGFDYSQTVYSIISQISSYEKVSIDCGSVPGVCFNLLDAGIRYDLRSDLIENNSGNSLNYMGVRWIEK